MKMSRAVCLTIFATLLKSMPASAVEIPINVGLGPSLFTIPDSILKTKIKPFTGVNVKLKAIIDKETIEKHKDRIPEKYRKAVLRTNEVRIGYLYIPAHIILAPGDDAGQPSIYGATWKPLSVDLPVKLGPAMLSLGTELLFTYAAITETTNSQNLQSTEKQKTTTHFIRPGLSLNSELEVPVSKSFLLSLGATAAYYIPQQLKGSDTSRDPLWRIGELRATLNYRFPVEVSL